LRSFCPSLAWSWWWLKSSTETYLRTFKKPHRSKGLNRWHPWLSSQELMARIGNKKVLTIHLSDEMAAMIDLKRKEWGLRSRGEVIESLLGWMIEPDEAEE